VRKRAKEGGREINSDDIIGQGEIEKRDRN
jgi:hypothetical protein